MNEQLIVKNFGPIKDATVDFKRVTVFIGPTGGGKSTLAKLAAVFREKILFSAEANKQYGILNELLYNYEINNYARKGSEFHWQVEDAGKFDKLDANEELVIAHLNLFPQIGSREEYITRELQSYITDNKINNINKLNASELYHLTEQFSKKFISETINWYNRRFLKIIYIPADRLFASAASRSLSELGILNTSLGKPISNFLKSFSTSSRRIGKFPISFLDVIFESDNFERKIISKGNSLNLFESASGIQSVAPMLSVILDKIHWNEISSKGENFSFIIEEPELNLYPEAQQGLLNWLVAECITETNNLVITTHSPYILSSCNLLLEAYKVAQQRPDLEEEIAAIVPKECWLNPDEFAAYYVADGTVKPITDERTHLIGGNELDSVSGDISDSFRKLLRLKKQVA